MDFAKLAHSEVIDGIARRMTPNSSFEPTRYGKRCKAGLRCSVHYLSPALTVLAYAGGSTRTLEVVPSQTLSTLHRAGSSFVPHPLVLSVFGTRRSMFFSGFTPPLLLFFQRVVIMAFCFNTFAMRKVSFSSVLAVPVFRFIIGKPFLTRRCSGLTHIAASTAELIRWASMKAFVAVIGFLVFAMPVAHADCGRTERVLFSCLSAKGKRIEVCNFGQTIQYSFGKPKAKPEISVSVPISKVEGVSCYACGRYISNSVHVPNKDTIYIVSWSSDKLDSDAPSESGVEVVVNGESKATIKCRGEPVVGNSEGIVFKEPVVEN